MSALVPTPLGNLAAASRTKVRIVTQAGLSCFNRSCYRGLHPGGGALRETGATVTFLPSWQVYVQGSVGCLYLSSYCLRYISIQSALFAFFTVVRGLLALILYSALSSVIDISYSCVFLLSSYLKKTSFIWRPTYPSSLSSKTGISVSVSSDASEKLLTYRSSTEDISLSERCSSSFKRNFDYVEFFLFYINYLRRS